MLSLDLWLNARSYSTNDLVYQTIIEPRQEAKPMSKIALALLSLVLLSGCAKTYIDADGNRYKETKDGLVKIEDGKS